MTKQELTQKIMTELDKRKTAHRERFTSKAFIDPNNQEDGEMTINGVQIVVVLSQSVGIPYKFYKIDDSFLDNRRQEIVDKIKKDYPEILFYICDPKNSSKTIDTENNMIVIDNDNFDTVVDLCGGINRFLETM